MTLAEYQHRRRIIDASRAGRRTLDRCRLDPPPPALMALHEAGAEERVAWYERQVERDMLRAYRAAMRGRRGRRPDTRALAAAGIRTARQGKRRSAAAQMITLARRYFGEPTHERGPRPARRTECRECGRRTRGGHRGLCKPCYARLRRYAIGCTECGHVPTDIGGLCYRCGTAARGAERAAT